MEMSFDLHELYALETSLFIDDCLGLPATEAADSEKKDSLFRRIIDAIVKFFVMIKNAIVAGWKKFVGLFSKKKDGSGSSNDNPNNDDTQKSLPGSGETPALPMKQTKEIDTHQSQSTKSTSTPLQQVAAKTQSTKEYDNNLSAAATKYLNADTKLVEDMRSIVIRANANVSKLNVIWFQNFIDIRNNGKNMGANLKTSDAAFNKMNETDTSQQISKNIQETINPDIEEFKNAQGAFRNAKAKSNGSFKISDRSYSIVKQLVDMMIKTCDDATKTCNNIKSKLEANKGYEKTACDSIMSKAYNVFYMCASQANKVQKLHQELMVDFVTAAKV